MKSLKWIAVILALVLTLGTTAAFAADSPFSDVPEDAYYADAVNWAVEKGITEGRPGGIFDPDATVNRAEAVTFLWRAAGRPEPAGTETFTDVEGDANNFWYKTAVQWAVEQGIVNGTGDGNYSPYMTCSRGMILTMLYRLNGCPWDGALEAEVPEDSSIWTLEDFGNFIAQYSVEVYRSEEGFTDIPEGAYYEMPVFWAVTSSIMDGNHVDLETMTARPTAPCPRGEIVYFLYRASGDAPILIEGDVEVGTISETVLFDSNGVKITATGIRSEGDTAVVQITVENGTDKALRVDADECYANTVFIAPQLCIPVEDENGWTFYVDAVVEPGATQDCQIRLNSLADKLIDTVYEMELTLRMDVVEKDEEGDYSYADDFAAGEAVLVRTSLYDESVSFELEGTTVYEKDGLKLAIVRAENDEFLGPEITLYAVNSGSEAAALELSDLKLDGEACEAWLSLLVPAGKQCVESVYISYDFEDPISPKEAELTLRIMDQETGEPKETLDPITVTFAE